MRAFVIALLLGACFGSADAQDDSLYLKNRMYRQLVGMFDIYRTTHADVVMLGNSITQGANWNELLNRPGIVNRGIGGDNTYGFLARLSQVYKLQPKLCFIMAGINDLYADIPVDTVVTNYRRILDTLEAHGITPVIQSTLFVSPQWKRASEKNREVARLDSLLERLAAHRNITYLDLNRVLSSNGFLKEEFTYDGVHLTPPAYARWRDELEKFLSKQSR